MISFIERYSICRYSTVHKLRTNKSSYAIDMHHLRTTTTTAQSFVKGALGWIHLLQLTNYPCVCHLFSSIYMKGVFTSQIPKQLIVPLLGRGQSEGDIHMWVPSLAGTMSCLWGCVTVGGKWGIHTRLIIKIPMAQFYESFPGWYWPIHETAPKPPN